MNTLSITKLKLTFVDQSQIKLFLMNLVKILLAVIVLHWTVSCVKKDPQYVHFRLSFMGNYRTDCARRQNLMFEQRIN